MGVGALTIFACLMFWPVMIGNTGIALAGDVFGPAMGALTLGLFSRGELARRLGLNSAFDHAGNVAIAAGAGLVGWWFSQRAVFLLVPACAMLAAAATLSISAAAIDHQRAREADADENGPCTTSGLGVLPTCRPLLVYAVRAPLPFRQCAPTAARGQKLALSHRRVATAMMSACIIAAQFIMLPIALAVGLYADRIGRKPIWLLGFALLPVRAALYTFSDDPT